MVAQGVTIEPVTDYNLIVANVRVHSKNASSIKGADISGRVSYNHSSKTLMLDGATLSNSATGASYVIMANNPLNVDLVGKNRINTEEATNNAIYFLNNGTIYSEKNFGLMTEGSLTTNANIEVGLNGASLSIYDTSIEANLITGRGYSTSWGSAGTSSGDINIRNSSVKVENGIKFFNDMVLEDAYIETPAGGRYNTDQYYVADSNGEFAPTVVITPGTEAPVEKYDLTIGGTTVNSRNKDDVLGDGVFLFNPNTKMLIVKGDYRGATTAIKSGIDNLYISFTRNSTLESTDSTVISLTGTTTITSNSGVQVTLKKSGENRYSGLYHAGAGKYLTISNMNLTINGNNKYGIVSAASTSKQSYLNISHSNIDVSATSVVLGDFKTLALSGCYLKSPAGATIQNGSVVDEYGSQITNGRVVISTEKPITLEDITALIDEYLQPGSSVQLTDITDLIDQYLAQ